VYKKLNDYFIQLSDLPIRILPEVPVGFWFKGFENNPNICESFKFLQKTLNMFCSGESTIAFTDFYAPNGKKNKIYLHKGVLKVVLDELGRPFGFMAFFSFDVNTTCLNRL